MLVTLGMTSQLKTWSTRLMWCFRVAVWHTILPLFGLSLCVFFANLTGSLGLIIGIGGGLLLAMLYGSLVKEAFQDETEDQSGSVSRNSFLRQLMLVAAVSLDSGLFAPTMLANVENWSSLGFLLSFLTAGSFVGLVGVGSVLFGIFISKRVFKEEAESENVEKSKFSFEFWGLFLEYVVIGYFGFYAILNRGVGLELPVFGILIVSAFVAGVFFFFLRKKIVRE